MAAATDSDGSVSKVEFYADGVLIATDTTPASFTATYNTSVTGTHSLTAVATDNLGAMTTSSPVMVSVTGGGGGTSGGTVTRTYIYDANQRLCKVIEPEAGATVIGYDAAGNIEWTATGTSLLSSACDRANVTAAMKSIRKYDPMSRLLEIDTPGGAADITNTYTPDGLIESTTVANGAGGANPVTTTYAYNKRRLLVSEVSSQYGYDLQYDYDANAGLKSLTYPDDKVVTYAPDAFGRPTAIKSGTQNYATAITYHANGAIKGFTYGNGIVHTMTQDGRMLPSRSKDQGATVVLDDAYAYDGNGNVTDIIDYARNNLTTRGMAYDGLDRLTAAVSPGQWGDALYTYDAADNIETASLGSRQFTYSYDSKNRLTNITGSQSYAFSYDSNGNAIAKGAQDFVFDSANRLASADLISGTGSQGYLYDALGRRVQANDPGSQAPMLWVYSKDGQLLYASEPRRNRNIAYIYLGNTQIATRSVAFGTGAVTIGFQHTDALGSPVAETSSSGAVVKRNNFTPYGEEVGTSSIDGTGFTGHVMDQGTGLTYMQQRYYDPICSCFFSVDPVSIYSNGDTRFFNRYAYAANNPYTFKDPDGRAIDTIVDAGFTIYDGGRFLGATAAWVHGELSGNESLANEGWQGMKETGTDLAGSASSMVIPGLPAPMVRGGANAAEAVVDAGLATRGYRAAPGERTLSGYADGVVKKAGGEVTVIRPSGQETIRVGGSGKHGISGAHAHGTYSNKLPNGQRKIGVSGSASPVSQKDVKELYKAINTSSYRTRGGP